MLSENTTELTQLELAVYAQNIRANKKSGNKSDKIKNNFCPCAKKLACKGDTYEILSKYYLDPKPKKNTPSIISNQEPEKVYLVTTSETINGKSKMEMTAYARCQNSRGQNQEYCERHTKQGDKRLIFSDFENKVNNDTVILLNDYEIDINGHIQKCPLGHPYFDRMHTKNKEAKKSSLQGDKKAIFEFDSKENKILCVLNHQNKAFTHCLQYCAEYILEHGCLPFDISSNNVEIPTPTVTRYTIKPVEKNNVENIENVKEINVNEDSLNKIFSQLSMNVESSNTTTENIQINKHIVEEEDVEEDDDNNSDSSKSTKNTRIREISDDEESESNSDEEDDEDDDDEEEFVIDPIFDDSNGEYGRVGKYGVEPKTKTVYFVSEEDEETEEVGELYQVNKKAYGKITYQGNPHIIGKNIIDSEKDDKELILCIWSNKIFDPETMNCLGEVKMKENKDGTKSIKSIKYRSDKSA